MKFWEAMKSLEEGKKVRNKRWVTGCYIYKEDIKYFTADGNLFCDFVRSIEGEWEIYEEKKPVDEDFKKLYSYLKNEDGFVNNQYSEFIYNEGEENHLLAFYRQLLRMSKYYNLD